MSVRGIASSSHHWIKKRLWLLPITAGLLLGLAFYRYWLGFLSFFALLPLLYFLAEAKKRRLGFWRFVLPIWGCGFLFFVIYLSWMLDIQPSSWAAIDGLPAAIGVGFSWLFSAFVFSAGFLLFAVAAYLLPEVNPKKGISVLVIPAVWVLCEFVRSWLYSAIAWGPEATIGAHWNFGNLGFAGSSTFLVPSTKILGLYGLSFAIVVINVLIYLALIKKRRAVAVAALVTLLTVVILSHFIYKPNGQKITVGSAQINKHSGEYSETLGTKISDVKSKGNENPELLVLPEESRFYYLPYDQQQEVLEAAFEDQAGYVITTDVQKDYGKNYAVLQLFDSKNNLLDAQQKVFLIPIGEYLPKIMEGILKIAAPPNEIAAYKEKRLHSKGTQQIVPLEVDNIKVGALACSGVISPELYRSLSRQGAEVLVNSASLDIFSKSQLYFEQSKQMARFQAAANSKPFVQSTLGGYSYIIDSSGRFIKETTTKDTAYIQATVATSKTKTLYVILGEWVLLASAVLIAGVLLNKFLASR